MSETKKDDITKIYENEITRQAYKRAFIAIIVLGTAVFFVSAVFAQVIFRNRSSIEDELGKCMASEAMTKEKEAKAENEFEACRNELNSITELLEEEKDKAMPVVVETLHHPTNWKKPSQGQGPHPQSQNRIPKSPY